MKKRLLSLLLALIMLLSMAACGESADYDDDDDDDDDTKASSVTTKEDDATTIPDGITATPGTDTDVTTDVNTPDGDAPVGDIDDPDYFLRNFNTKGSIGKTVLYEDANVKLTATDIKYNEYNIELICEIQNKTQHKAYCSSWSGLCINGTMTSSFIGGYVDPLETETETAYISYEELCLLGIKDISLIEMEVYYEDDNTTGGIVGSAELKTALYPSYTYDDNSFRSSITAKNHPLASMLKVNSHKKANLYSEGGMTVSSVTFIEYSGAEWILLEVDNRANETLNFTLDDISLNGVCFNDYEEVSVLANKKGVLMLECDWIAHPDVREAYGIGQITKLSGHAKVIDNSYNTIAEYSAFKAEIENTSSTVDTAGTAIYDKGGVKLIYRGVEYDNSDNYNSAYVYILVENKHADKYLIGLRQNYEKDIKINGTAAEDAYLRTVYVNRGEYGAFYIEIGSDQLGALGIKSAADIKKVEISCELEAGDLNETDILDAFDLTIDVK